MNETIGNRIKTLRSEKGWTQAELAEKAHLGVATVQNYERKGRTDSVISRTVVKLAKALDTTADYLLQGESKTLRDEQAFWQYIGETVHEAITQRKAVMICDGNIYEPSTDDKIGTFNLIVVLNYDEEEDVEG